MMIFETLNRSIWTSYYHLISITYLFGCYTYDKPIYTSILYSVVCIDSFIYVLCVVTFLASRTALVPLQSIAFLLYIILNSTFQASNFIIIIFSTLVLCWNIFPSYWIRLHGSFPGLLLFSLFTFIFNSDFANWLFVLFLAIYLFYTGLCMLE